MDFEHTLYIHILPLTLQKSLVSYYYYIAAIFITDIITCRVVYGNNFLKKINHGNFKSITVMKDVAPAVKWDSEQDCRVARRFISHIAIILNAGDVYAWGWIWLINHTQWEGGCTESRKNDGSMSLTPCSQLTSHLIAEAIRGILLSFNHCISLYIGHIYNTHTHTEPHACYIWSPLYQLVYTISTNLNSH